MDTSAVLSFRDLGVTPPDVYACMGYRGGTPDAETCSVVERLLSELGERVTPACRMLILPGEVGESTVRINGTSFDTPGPIVRILSGAESFAVYLVTAGQAYDDWLTEVKGRGDILGEFVADAIGSATAEKMGAYVKSTLEKELNGANHSSSFNPGQCDWPLTEQRKLFAVLGDDHLGVTLGESCLMHPIKSVSGIIGIGEGVTPGVTSCDLCPRKECFRRHEGHA